MRFLGVILIVIVVAVWGWSHHDPSNHGTCHPVSVSIGNEPTVED
jgi:hypothetical protein